MVYMCGSWNRHPLSIPPSRFPPYITFSLTPFIVSPHSSLSPSLSRYLILPPPFNSPLLTLSTLSFILTHNSDPPPLSLSPRGSSPLALSGMTEAGISNGVHVWRPLLAHPKADILDFAHK